MRGSLQTLVDEYVAQQQAAEAEQKRQSEAMSEAFKGFVAPAEAMENDARAEKSAEGKDASGRLYRKNIFGEREVYNYTTHKWQPE